MTIVQSSLNLHNLIRDHLICSPVYHELGPLAFLAMYLYRAWTFPFASIFSQLCISLIDSQMCNLSPSLLLKTRWMAFKVRLSRINSSPYSCYLMSTALVITFQRNPPYKCLYGQNVRT